SMRVRFWGVRGSCPSPVSVDALEGRLAEVLAALGESKAPPNLHDLQSVNAWVKSLPLHLRRFAGGNTPCVEMQTASGELFILDLGSGARVLGNALMNGAFGRGEGRAHIFL